MQIVIDIPKKVYKAICDKNALGCAIRDIKNIIRNGTPLPKGHGRLIDAGIIKDLKNKIKHYGKDYKFTQEEILNMLERYEIKYAPTIAEVDKEEE